MHYLLLTLLFQIGEVIQSAPEILHALGGWPPVLIALLLICSALVAMAYAPVLAMRDKDKATAAEMKEQRQAHKESLEAEEKSRLAVAQEYRQGSHAMAAAFDRLSEQLGALQQTIAAGQGEQRHLASLMAESNAKLSSLIGDVQIVKDRTKRNGSGS